MLIHPQLSFSFRFHLSEESVNKTCAICAKNLSQCEKTNTRGENKELAFWWLH